jgi:hypothetical protein
MTEPSTEEPGQPLEGDRRPEGLDTEARTGRAETEDEPDTDQRRQSVRHIHIEIDARIVDVPEKPRPDAPTVR